MGHVIYVIIAISVIFDIPAISASHPKIASQVAIRRMGGLTL